MSATSRGRTSRTVMDATTSPRASFSLTVLRRISRIAMAGPPSLPVLALAMCRRYAAGIRSHSGKRPKLSMNYTTQLQSIRAEVSPEELQARVDLAPRQCKVHQYALDRLDYHHITQ